VTMPIHVCPLSKLGATVTASGARHVITLVNVATEVSRPEGIEAGDHLFVGISDIVEPLEGHVLPAQSHVEELLAFASRWDRTKPLVIHCYAGVSRSTAAAYVIACAIDPARDEMEAALALRAASPTATPNPLMVAIADRHLRREGRMIAAIAAIGRGVDCFEGVPFAYAV
jgi:predicted protein tyrosine phosphatase